MSAHAVVTGGAGGIGRAVVRRLLARGAAVSVLDADGDALDRLRAEFDAGTDGRRLRTAPVDVTDPVAVFDAMAGAAACAGPPDALAACAGVIGQRVPALDVDVEAWRRVLDVHLMGTFHACRAFTRLRPRPAPWSPQPAGPAGGAGGAGASIVTVSSIVAAGGFTNQADYGTAKAAIESLTKVLAVEWAPLGIRVNAVAPGYTATPMVASMTAAGFDLGPVAARTPMGRLADPDETAAAIEFLLEDAGFVTGVVLPVDGGWTAVGR